MLGRIHGLVLLAWAFVAMLVRRLFSTGPSGALRFRLNFEPEGLYALTKDESEKLPAFSRCIACGRCDQGDGARMAASRGAYPGTMALMLASSRSMPDFVAAAAALRFITPEELSEKEKLCPVNVPIRRVAAFIASNAAPLAGLGPPSP